MMIVSDHGWQLEGDQSAFSLIGADIGLQMALDQHWGIE